jgi:hypothetical protein
MGGRYEAGWKAGPDALIVQRKLYDLMYEGYDSASPRLIASSAYTRGHRTSLVRARKGQLPTSRGTTYTSHHHGYTQGIVDDFNLASDDTTNQSKHASSYILNYIPSGDYVFGMPHCQRNEKRRLFTQTSWDRRPL